MRNRKFSRRIVWFVVLVLVSFTMIFVTGIQGRGIITISNAVHNVLSVVENIFAAPVRFVSQKAEAIQDLLGTYHENKMLKEKVNQLENQKIENDNLIKENKNLKKNQEIADTFSSITKVSAGVIDRNPTTWNQNLTINKGKNQGLKPDMLVVSNGGIIGQISAVYADSSVVSLYSNTAPKSKLPVKILNTNESSYGFLSGYDDRTNCFTITYLTSNQVKEGDSVVTSDLSDKILRNIPIGTVTRVERKASDASVRVYVRSQADFSDLYHVIVIGEGND